MRFPNELTRQLTEEPRRSQGSKDVPAEGIFGRFLAESGGVVLGLIAQDDLVKLRRVDDEVSPNVAVAIRAGRMTVDAVLRTKRAALSPTLRGIKPLRASPDEAANLFRRGIPMDVRIQLFDAIGKRIR